MPPKRSKRNAFQKGCLLHFCWAIIERRHPDVSWWLRRGSWKASAGAHQPPCLSSLGLGGVSSRECLDFQKKQQTLPNSLFQRNSSQSFLYRPLLDSNKRRNAAGGHHPRSCVPSGHLPLPDAFGLQMSGGGGDRIESQNSKICG